MPAVSWIAASDPLALVAIAAGQVPTPASETGAAGGGKLDTPQRAVELGEPVPIVFGRRRNSKGGVLISPGATEARFENDTSNAVTVWYHLVLSEGQIDSIPVKDVFQRSCRVGSHSQTYNRRAGTWTPGNAIVAREGYDMPECPYYCGTRGAYPGMSTLSFTNTIPDGFDQWNRQVHCFIRGGMHVTRLNDDVDGPSDSFADLVLWMLTNSGRVPSALIDTTALTAADLFLEENGFTCNCWITESQNYGDLLAKWAPYFLLGESNNGGKKGLRPLLPVTETGAIDTGAISWKYAFNEDTIIPGSLEIQYTSLADRLPFVAQITWRQQLEDDFGIIRTAEVRYSGTAESGPYESHDLSAFCTSENHAVKVGAYLLAKRVYTTHTIRFSARPQAHNTLLSPGDIIRVTLDRTATAAAPSQHDYLYQVERISKTLAGDVSYECTHFPVDSQGRSLVALDVAAAQGTGILLSSNKTGVGCDVNSSSNNTIPAETWSPADNLGLGNQSVTLSLTSEQRPQRTGIFSFTVVTVEASDDPNIWIITVSATCDPPPINTSDGIEEDNVPPGPEDQLSITLDNGQTFYIPPLIQPATEVQDQLIFEDDVSSETLPVTRTLAVTSWSGGGFDTLDVTDTIQYVIQEQVEDPAVQLNGFTAQLVPVPGTEGYEVQTTPATGIVSNGYNQYFLALWSVNQQWLAYGYNFFEVTFYTYTGSEYVILYGDSILGPTLTPLNGAQMITAPLESWPAFPYGSSIFVTFTGPLYDYGDETYTETEIVYNPDGDGFTHSEVPREDGYFNLIVYSGGNVQLWSRSQLISYSFITTPP